MNIITLPFIRFSTPSDHLAAGYRSYRHQIFLRIFPNDGTQKYDRGKDEGNPIFKPSDHARIFSNRTQGLEIFSNGTQGPCWRSY